MSAPRDGLNEPIVLSRRFVEERDGRVCVIDEAYDLSTKEGRMAVWHLLDLAGASDLRRARIARGLEPAKHPFVTEGGQRRAVRPDRVEWLHLPVAPDGKSYTAIESVYPPPTRQPPATPFMKAAARQAEEDILREYLRSRL